MGRLRLEELQSMHRKVLPPLWLHKKGSVGGFFVATPSIYNIRPLKASSG